MIIMSARSKTETTSRSELKKPALIAKKESLTEAIAKLFYEKGYEKTSTRDIAASLSIPGSLLYYYFKNKQEMLFSIVDEAMENTIPILREKVEPINNAEDKLAVIVDCHIRFFVSHPFHSKVFIMDGHSLEGEYRRIIAGKERWYFEFVRKVLAEIIESNNTDLDVNTATFSLFGILNWTYFWYSPDGRVSPDDLAKNIVKMVLPGLKGLSSRQSPKKEAQRLKNQSSQGKM